MLAATSAMRILSLMLRSVLLAALTACAATSACLQPVSGNEGLAPKEALWHGDTRFTAQERACVEAAASRLNAQVGKVVHTHIVWDYSVYGHTPGHRIVRLVGSDPAVGEREAMEDLEGEALLGVCYSDVRTEGHVALVADRVQDPELCTLVAMHELVHGYALTEHLREDGNVMSRHIGAHCLTQDDLDYFCAVWSAYSPRELCASVVSLECK